MLNRSVVMAARYLDGIVPEVDGNQEVLKALKAQTDETLNAVGEAIDAMNPNAVLDAVWKLVREANRFVEVQAPWHLVKDASKRTELEVTIYALLETMRQLSVLLFPVIPSKACEIWQQLGAKGSPGDIHLDDLKTWGGLDANLKVVPGDPVFPRIEEVNVKKKRRKI